MLPSNVLILPIGNQEFFVYGHGVALITSYQLAFGGLLRVLRVSFYLGLNSIVTAINCQLESLSTVDMWLANNFCSTEGFFLFLYCPLKLFFAPGIAGG